DGDVDQQRGADQPAEVEHQAGSRSATQMTADSGTTPLEVGELLVEQGKLTAAQLEQARRRQKRLNLPQHRAIVDLNFASEEDTWRALAEVNRLEFVDPAALELKPETLALVPLKLIFHHHMLPIAGDAES